MMIGKLTSLQTLPFFVVGWDEGQKIEELGSLSKLRGKLMIYNLQWVESREEVEKAKILGKPNIRKLGFHWDRVGNPSTAGDITSINHEGVLEGLKSHGNLKGLKLQNFEGKSFASWMMSGRDAQSLQNLVKIKLSECTRCEQAPPLGHLPHLEVIKIYSGVVTTATAKALAVVFPALREIHLEDMLKIEEWCGLGVSSSLLDTTMFFPLLESVIIINCLELTTIPGLFSEELEYFPWPSTTLSAASASAFTSASTTATAEEEVDDDDTKYHPNPKHYPFISLVSLTLYGWERLKYLPDQLQHLTTLRELSILWFRGLEALPGWLGNLSSLHSLELYECQTLMNLPTLEAMQRLTNL
ncbi:putative disease resistance protein RGA3 [Camellia lanceoleosa]|uniref:Disease resistance protein RGA3 n=1 Tax=Camellia lanceoleosa TaxID=1840588 RepID=A0ACC0GY87_9ERIC|nr:putative disease resistance protein RGA3 [Camellia lanceoleosa]